MEIAIAKAKGKLTQLVAAAERGEQVVITRHGKPAVRLVAAYPSPKSRFSLAPGSPWRQRFGLDGPELPTGDIVDDLDFSLEVLGLK
jgi:prevent-host-death family protein